MELSPHAAPLEQAGLEVLGADAGLAFGGALKRGATQLERVPQGRPVRNWSFRKFISSSAAPPITQKPW
jgi:hypothetical protein